MLELTTDNLLNFLKNKDYDVKLQKETNQIYMILKISQTDFPVFFKVSSEGELLQLLIFLPGTIKEDALPQVARLLHFINKQLDMPGFGMDEEAGVMFYRVMLPAVNKKMNEKLLESYLDVLKPVCETFAPAILNVSAGQMTYDEVLEKLKKATKSHG